jgi:hypothetical protein
MLTGLQTEAKTYKRTNTQTAHAQTHKHTNQSVVCALAFVAGACCCVCGWLLFCVCRWWVAGVCCWRLLLALVLFGFCPLLVARCVLPACCCLLLLVVGRLLLSAAVLFALFLNCWLVVAWLAGWLAGWLLVACWLLVVLLLDGA